MTDYAAARRQMVVTQLQPSNINDRRVAEAMMAVPRERFVPVSLAGVAYIDEDLEIAPGRHLMEPLIFAKLLQAASCTTDEIVLDVSCGCGYSAAVLGRLAGTVVALESDAELADDAGERLSEIEADNVVVITGNAADGYAEQGPYDVIVVEGGVAEIPLALIDQLAEGGRLAVVVVRDGIGRGTMVSKRDGVLIEEQLFDAMLPVLTEFAPAPEFSF